MATTNWHKFQLSKWIYTRYAHVSLCLRSDLFMVKGVTTFDTPKIIAHVFVLVNFVSFLYIEAFITQTARKFPLTSMLRHVRLQWSFIFKSPDRTDYTGTKYPHVWTHTWAHVVSFLVISLFTFGTIKAEVACVNFHVSL